MRLATNGYLYIDAVDRKKLRLPEPKLTKYTVYQYFTPKQEWFIAFINEPKKKWLPGTYYTINETTGNRFKSILKSSQSKKLVFEVVNFNKKIIKIKLQGEHAND